MTLSGKFLTGQHSGCTSYPLVLPARGYRRGGVFAAWRETCGVRSSVGWWSDA